MNITYIYHSCFLVETAECYYLFDYYKGDLPALDADKPVLVFVSHSHQDHYNPAVLSMLRAMGMKKIGALLPNDIKPKNYPEGWSLLPDSPCAKISLKDSTSWEETPPSGLFMGNAAASDRGFPSMDALDNHILKVYHSKEYTLPCRTQIRALLSTDSGVAFLLTCPEGIFYHAGDLNDWITEDTPKEERRQMTGSFRAALRPLKDLSIDHACLPLDPHLGRHYADGFLYFLKNLNVKKVYPMHFWDKPEIVARFLEEYPEYRERIIVPT